MPESILTYVTVWQDLSYACEFTKPILELARENVSVLTNLHDAIGTRFPVKPSDLRSFGGNSMSEVRVVASSFNDQASVELDVERFICQVSGVRSSEDLVVAHDFTALATESIQDSLPKLSISKSTLGMSGHLEIEGLRESGATAFLASMMSDAAREAAGNLAGDGVAEFGFSVELSDARQGWNGHLRIERSLLETADLFVNATMEFRPESPVLSYSDRFHLGTGTLASALAAFGMTPTEEANQ